MRTVSKRFDLKRTLFVWYSHGWRLAGYGMSEETEEEEGSARRRGTKTIRDAQKSHLEKLMANPVLACSAAMHS